MKSNLAVIITIITLILQFEFFIRQIISLEKIIFYYIVLIYFQITYVLSERFYPNMRYKFLIAHRHIKTNFSHQFLTWILQAAITF